VKIGQRLRFLGQPGTHRSRRAVKLVSNVEMEEEF
jgi:hypothetical protein